MSANLWQWRINSKIRIHPKQNNYLQMANGLTNLSLWFRRDVDTSSSLFKTEARVWTCDKSSVELALSAKRKVCPDGLMAGEREKPCELAATMANGYIPTAVIASPAEPHQVFKLTRMHLLVTLSTPDSICQSPQNPLQK